MRLGRIQLISPFILSALLLMLQINVQAQRPSGNRPGSGGRSMNIGNMYGKIVNENGKGIPYATVQIFRTAFDSVSQKKTEKLITGQITRENGDFNLDKLPVRGQLVLKVDVMGYASMEQEVSFPQLDWGGQGRQGGRPSGGRENWSGGGMGSAFTKDLGNIALTAETGTLDEVMIEADATVVTLALDKKVYNVEKNALAAGGTAEDALRNVPSLSVDLDGNLTLRNASPQLFIDGRPTTLSLDQLSADEIKSVEIITNPSAKYDASGGQAGIVNIVLKKERKLGYNGSLRAGVDSRGGFNSGGNINAREGKINLFLSANLNSRNRKGVGETYRQNLIGSPPTNVLQVSDNIGKGTFARVRGGLDWFIDNRNTITFQGSFMRGSFNSEDHIDITTDSLFGSNPTFSESIRLSASNRQFQNTGASILFKHLFPKDGQEWTADVNFNKIQSGGTGSFSNQYISLNREVNEFQENDGGSTFMTFQTDYVDPITKQIKIETGLRAAVRDYTSNNASYLQTGPGVEDKIRVPNFADAYEFQDAVFAAYGTFSHQFTRIGYQVGLRAESSQYTGVLPENNQSFENDYPISLFPSVFVTYKVNELDNLQLSYSRRINRPNFFQLMPFTDFSDSLNLRRGNPNLLPEFTNSVEMTYQNIIKRGHDFLLSVYYKEATDLITTYQFLETIGDREVLMRSYENSNKSLAYGMEFTMRNTFTKSIELTTNLNVYNSKVDASNVQADLVNEQVSWFIKENINIRLPGKIRLQISGEYQSRAAFSPVSSSGRFRGYHRRVTNTAQGYRIPFWFVDVALRKDLFNRKASLTVSMRDVFRTRKSGTYTETMFFIQDSWRLRNPQVVSVNFSYRFGKPDASLFRRKNNNMNNNGSDMMGG